MTTRADKLLPDLAWRGIDRFGAARSRRVLRRNTTGVYGALSSVAPLTPLFASSRLAGPVTLNVVAPSFAPRNRFAGVLTAVEFGALTARELGVPLRVVTLEPIPQRLVADYSGELQKLTGDRGSSVLSLQSPDCRFNADDYWQATYWSTAHALDIAARTQLIDSARVVYVVQDYEPHFFAWSTEAALARSTYHAGFTLVVNSKPLRDYLSREEGIPVSDERTFAPTLDYAALARVADDRPQGRAAGLNIFFYARPGKPRNLYPIGVTALRLFAQMWAAHPLSRSLKVTVTAAGDRVSSLLLGTVGEKLVGKTTYAQYYDLLARSRVSLSLMMSPHPSHPPLESAISGGLSVTNEFEDYRRGLHPGLILAQPRPEPLAVALLNAVVRADDEPPRAFQPVPPEVLGGPVAEVAAKVAGSLPG